MKNVASHRTGLLLFLTAATVVLAACRDAPADPLASVIAEETGGALQTSERLPSVPALAERWGVEDEGLVERWRESWRMTGDDGRAARSAVYEELASLRPARVPAGAFSEDLRGLQEVIAAADALAADGLGPRVTGALAEAEATFELARSADDPGRRLVLMLRAADQIREVGPEAVTRRLIALSEARIEAMDEADDVDGVLGRSEHLVLGARMALADGEHTLALRRAHYAAQLLGIVLD